ncbi:MAG: hypothetical protein MJ217_02020 [Bacilli bacterium]|nr:hypothetical protein [Bacilli bacterium]
MAKKEQKTIEQKLREKKYTIASNLEWLAYGIVARMPFFGPKYKVHYKVIDNPGEAKDGCFLIWNHQSRRDYLFLKNLISPTKFNMVAGFPEFNRKKFTWLFNRAHVIPKKSFGSFDPVGLKAMTSIIKQGGCVAFSPEGCSSVYGCQQPIVPGTARFLQFFKKPVYFMHLEGAYLTSTKVCIQDRPGRINASVRLLFSPEDLAKMSPDEIDAKINEVMWHDDYEWNKTARIKYKTKKNACNRLDDLIYKCPKCGAELTISANGDRIECTNCGNGATLDDYYDFHPFNNECKIPVSPSAWFAYQRMEIIKEIRNNVDFSMKVNVEVGELPKYKPIKKNNINSLPCGNGVMIFDHQGIHFEGVKHDEPWKFDLSYESMFTILIENECDCMSFYVNNEYFEFKPDQKLVGKCLLVTEEMHRLHFNVWKNYPWNSYMYHGTELESENDNYEENVGKIFLKNE